MNNIRTSSHIRTHRTLRSFRACVNATGAQQILSDRGRVHHEESRRLNREWQFARKRAAQSRRGA
ncbi:MAG: hypothetical protein ACKN9T_02060 [Candidatus Methylumidiphilus sp.]